jgi:RHS repeat-associated protein
VHELRYSPLGDIANSDGASPLRHTFTGQESDAETGLLYYRSRYYDPKLGRFLSPDSLIPDRHGPQSWNRYAYVLNNPLRYADPSGHSFKSAMKKLGDWAKAVFTTRKEPPTSHTGEPDHVSSPSFSEPGSPAPKSPLQTYDELTTLYGLGGGITNFVRAEVVDQIINSVVTGGTMERAVSELLGHPASSREVQGVVTASGLIMSYLYEAVVGFAPSVHPGGEAAIDLPLKGEWDGPVRGANNIGLQGKVGFHFFDEGGWAARVLNHIPLVNGVAGLHDAFQVNLTGSWGPYPTRSVLNIPGMFVAAPATALAVYGRPERLLDLSSSGVDGGGLSPGF